MLESKVTEDPAPRGTSVIRTKLPRTKVNNRAASALSHHQRNQSDILSLLQSNNARIFTQADSLGCDDPAEGKPEQISHPPL